MASIMHGKYASATVHTDNLDSTTTSQVQHLLDNEVSAGSTIHIMPDAHAGKGCTIGTTMTVTDKVVPNLVGVDIGCGVMAILTGVSVDSIDFSELDDAIREYVPHGFSTQREEYRDSTGDYLLDSIHAAEINKERARYSMGTLGGGNHFIEINDCDGSAVLTIHTGSRNLGKQIAEWHQGVAIERMSAGGADFDRDLAYLTGDDMTRYLVDMRLAQLWAELNRMSVSSAIMTAMGWVPLDVFDTAHNYIDEKGVLRKGAIDTSHGERVAIPLNMRDGTVLGVGRGNGAWNNSGPHGAGRVLSRSKAKKILSVDEFKREMGKVWSSCVSACTLDESPMAYKSSSDILAVIGETVDVYSVVKPVYNFKSSEKR